jgi:hypothetical protein
MADADAQEYCRAYNDSVEIHIITIFADAKIGKNDGIF